MVSHSASRGGLSPNTITTSILRVLLTACLMLAATWYEAPAAAETATMGSDTSRAEMYLERAIRNQLAADKSIDIKNLSVEIEGGRVILRGVVDNLQARQKAEKSVRNRIGVTRITNLLRVESDEAQDGELWLSGRVREALDANPYLSGREIGVSEDGNVVRLEGVVESRFQKEQAGRSAAAVRGVAGVDNRIAVIRDPMAAVTAGPRPGEVIDPTVQAIINSYYKAQGVNPDLAFRIDKNIAANWQDSVEVDPPKAGGKPLVVNPETGYYEHFNFLSAGMYAVKKLFWWVKQEED